MSSRPIADFVRKMERTVEKRLDCKRRDRGIRELGEPLCGLL